MLSWVLKNISWKSFAIGAGTALYGGAVARPVAVRAVKVGMNVGSFATGVVNQAATELASIKEDAARLRAGGTSDPILAELVAELRNLRTEISSLKAGMAKTPPKPASA